MATTPERRSEQYRVRLRPSEKRALEQMADRAGYSLADVFRLGARDWLLARIRHGEPRYVAPDERLAA